MSVPAPWLATFVEQCLGSYLGKTAHNGIEVEDDGATLSFRKPELTSLAAISEVCSLCLNTRYKKADIPLGFHQWGLGSSHDRACLMDADNQILAMFPHDLSDLSPLPPHSKETNPRKHQIELLEFALVFTYSTSTPDVHLNVNRFRINWQEGIIQGLTPTKKLRRNRTVKVLLDKALQEAKSKRLVPRPDGPRIPPAQSPRPGDQHLPQSQNRPQHGTQSQQIFSQMPAHNHDVVHHTLSVERSRLHGANELLQHLDPSSRPSSRNSVRLSMQRQEQSTRPLASRGPLRVLVDGEPTANGFRRSASPLEDRSDGEDSISSQPQNTTLNPRRSEEVNSPHIAKLSSPQNVRHRTASALLDPGERTDAQLPSQVASRSPSRKRHRESAETQPEHGCGDSHSLRPTQEVAPKPPSRKRQRIDDTIPEKSPGKPVSPDQPAIEVLLVKRNQAVEINANPAIDPPPLTRDPWQGLAKISARDVNIPKDQLELLDGNLCWIPARPGDPEPRGHVPAWLLQQWNNIARLRHRQNHEDLASKEIERRPATPISSQSTSPSSDGESEEQFYEWEGSSPVQPPQNLPPESSPMRQPMSMRFHETPEASNQTKRLDGTTDSKEGSQFLNESTEHLQTLDISAPGVIPQNEPVKSNLDTNSGDLVVSTQDIVEDHDQSGNVEVQGSPTSPRGQKLDQTPLLSKEGSCTNSDTSEFVGEQSENEPPSDDESDEDSVMENSVPFALGESLPPTQCSQAEEDSADSAQPPSQLIRDHVQVAVTPLVINNRPREHPGLNQEKSDSTHLRFSSQSNKHSSQSQVPNTYPYLGSHEKSQSSNDPTTSSSLHSEGGAFQAQIAVPQTQSSGTSRHSQGTYEASINEVVLESSNPSQRPHDIPCLGAPGLSNHLPASSADLASSQPQQPTQEPMTQTSIDEPRSSPQVSSLRQFNSAAASPYQTPSKSPPDMTQEIPPISQTIPSTQSAELVARRSGFIGDLEKSVEAQAVFKKFCNDYPGYAGDYSHFTELCSKLQAVRAQGLLRRSNLWDDFIIMHLQQYIPYLENCASEMSNEPLSYENYFTSHFLKSMHKKRSLSGYSIEVVASQFAQPEVIPTHASSQADPPSQTTHAELMDASLATSFVDKFSNFHAHSFEEPVKNGLPVFQLGLPALESHVTSSSQTNPGSSSVLVKLEGDSEMDPNEVLCTHPAPMSLLDDISALCSPQPHTAEREPSESQNANAQDEQDDVSMAEDDKMDDEELDADDTRHETASVELGDDTFISSVSQSHADEIPETQPDSEVEDEEENWFVSLRRIWSKDEPAWSDDPTTPFKTWAEADQNVLSERRRRGGSKILLDDKGVIRRPVCR